MKNTFFKISIPILLGLALISLFIPILSLLFFIVMPLFILGLYDILQRQHTILRNYPVIGHFRFLFEAIRPEIYQYFIESDQEGRPINREDRSVIYERAKNVLDTQPYGTRKDVDAIGYQWVNHSLKAHRPSNMDPRVTIGNEQCAQPYSASLLNISALSFGAISPNAVLALNRGAQLGHFFHNTGEGGISQYHLLYGGDLVWQIGTAYFGCRTADGGFCEKIFAERANISNVKMIELKLSQGAKPGHGGILPGRKLTKEIAELRGVSMDKDVISPPVHSTFHTPIELMQFIARLRQLTEGKPIGFKLCLGLRTQFLAICKAMLATKIYPDFISIDGGEGGTGAAPLEFANSVGTPLDDALVFIHNALVGSGLRNHIKIIASGKIFTGFSLTTKLALGADLCNSARGMMLALGCVQSLVCNTNRCPTGVTTLDPGLTYGLVVEDKYLRVADFHRLTVKSVCELAGAAGLDSPNDFKPYHVFKRLSETEVKPYDEIYPYLHAGALLEKPTPEPYARSWDLANAEEF